MESLQDDNMKPLDKTLLVRLEVYLLRSNNEVFCVDEIVNELTACKCISALQQEYITEAKTGRQKTKRLVEVLTRRTVADYWKFVGLVDQNQPLLADLLRGKPQGGFVVILVCYVDILLCLSWK